MEKAGYQFESYSLEISEIVDENLNPQEQVEELARFKMSQFLETYDEKKPAYFAAMTFDTMVEFKGRVLGKPKNKNEALGWLLSYSGHSQKVHTGCCLHSFSKKKIKIWTSTSTVYFKNYTKDDVLKYLDAEPSFVDKAGAYGIQDNKFDLVEKIQGEYSNIVGLPLKRLAEELKDWTL